jgi:hypothetical protein
MGNSSGKMKVLHEVAVVPAPVTENGTPADIENPDKIETVTLTAGEAVEITANNSERENKTPENVSDAETSAVKKKSKPHSWFKKLSFKKDRKSKGSVETPHENAEKKEEKATEGETAVEVKPEEDNGITQEETQATEPVVVVYEIKVEEETQTTEPVVVVYEIEVEETPSSTQCQLTSIYAVKTPVTADVVTDSAEATTNATSEEKVEETNTTDTPTTITSEPEVTSTTVPSEKVITNGHHQKEESKGDNSKEESHPITNGINGCHDEESEKQQTPAAGDVTSNESSKDVAASSLDFKSLEVNH